MAPVLGYWNIRGLAQPIRLMLAYTQTKFEDKKYAYGPPPEFDRSEWTNEKYSLGLAFPNLPYYIDGDVKLTQSLTIMRYLARKHKLDGDSEEEKQKIELVEQEIADLRMAFATMCYKPNFEQLKELYLKVLPPTLKLLSDFLGSNSWFSGGKLSYVDFLVYEVLDHNIALVSDCLEKFQNLIDFMERFKNLPTIQKYMQSEDFMKWPLNGDPAKFGSRITE